MGCQRVATKSKRDFTSKNVVLASRSNHKLNGQTECIFTCIFLSCKFMKDPAKVASSLKFSLYEIGLFTGPYLDFLKGLIKIKLYPPTIDLKLVIIE